MISDRQISNQILNQILIKFKITEIVKVRLGDNAVQQIIITQKQLKLQSNISNVLIARQCHRLSASRLHSA